MRTSAFVVLLLVALTKGEGRDHWSNASTSFLVTYFGYYNIEARRECINSAFAPLNVIRSVELRPGALSDFDVIEVSAAIAYQIASKLRSSKCIRRVSDNTRHSTRQTLLRRSLPSTASEHITHLIGAEKLWDIGLKGQGVRIGIFDTGLAADHSGFKNVVERTDWTNEHTADDGLGHGTFVAGVIAGSHARCPGIAPSAEIHIYKVFTKRQASRG